MNAESKLACMGIYSAPDTHWFIISIASTLVIDIESTSSLARRSSGEYISEKSVDLTICY